MAREHNWADNHSFIARHVHRPDSLDAARRLVAGSPRIHAIGARHSFNGAADSPGDLIDLGAIPPDIRIDPEQRTASMGATTNYGVLADALHAQGWALHNLASLPHISVAGAVATGTHGSGDGNGTLSSAVAGLDLITAGGDLVSLRRGDPGFEGIVVGLGAFGVVVRVTLDIQPSFNLRQDAFTDLPWSVLLTDLDAVMSAAYSVSLMTMWSGDNVGRLWLKTRLDAGRPGPASVAHFGARPAARATMTASDDATSGLNPFGVAGSWSTRLAHFRPDSLPGTAEQIQSEYMVPRAQAVTALARLRAIADRIDRHLHVSEIRSMAADALWLSPAQGHDAVAIHFTWKREPEAVADLTREIEALLLPLGARPHWGKVIHAPAADLEKVYPHLPAFRELVSSYDRSGKFRNAFLNKHIFD